MKAKYLWKVLVPGIVRDEDIYRHILKNRGIDDPEYFFSMGEEVLHDPFLISGMDRAVKRVHRALSSNEKILIFGDYDCDGISAISVLFRTLKKLGANVFYDLPDRFQDGYGLNMRAVEKIIENGYQLVITVDNGITCNDEVKALQTAGIDTIITDHHEEKEELPEAYQILHTKLSPQYPFKEIAGVMVAFKFAQAISGKKLEYLYDLVMIGTIADLMPLVDENQAMVNLGLKQLKQTTNPGLRKLLEFSNLDVINETAIAFKIAPKINSSGRLGKALEAVKLLVSDSDSEVNELIYQIEENHANRKDLTAEAVSLCEKLVNHEDDVLLVATASIHEGVIGICAQKLAEKHQKSSLVITFDENGIGKGSMRSFGNDNILEMLEKNRDLLIRYGGHAQAAGLQIAKENIEALRRGLNDSSGNKSVPVLKVDMEISLDEVKVETVKKLQDLSFFTATFLFSDLTITRKQLLNNQHTKLLVEKNNRSFDVLYFNNTEYFYRLTEGDVVSFVGGMNINIWRSRTSIQVIVKDLQCNHFQALDFRNLPEWETLHNWANETDFQVINDQVLSLEKISHNVSTVIVTPRTDTPMIRTWLTKEMLLRCYRFVESVEKADFQSIAKQIPLANKALEILLTILTEINLLKLEADQYWFLPTQEKRDLRKSKTYSYWLNLNEQIEKIYSLPSSDLRPYIHTIMEEPK